MTLSYSASVNSTWMGIVYLFICLFVLDFPCPMTGRLNMHWGQTLFQMYAVWRCWWCHLLYLFETGVQTHTKTFKHRSVLCWGLPSAECTSGLFELKLLQTSARLYVSICRSFCCCLCFLLRWLTVDAAPMCIQRDTLSSPFSPIHERARWSCFLLDAN